MPFPRKRDSKWSSECKSKSSMVKVQVSFQIVSFQINHSKRDLWWPSRTSLCIPMTISSLVFAGTGCSSIHGVPRCATICPLLQPVPQTGFTAFTVHLGTPWMPFAFTVHLGTPWHSMPFRHTVNAIYPHGGRKSLERKNVYFCGKFRSWREIT